MKTIFQIPDMHCPSCVMRVESVEDELEGIRWATASYKKQQLIVEYDETIVSEDEIINYLRHLGYQASVQ